MKVELVGDRELEAKLRQVRAAVGKVLDDAGESGANIIQAEAAHRAPGPHIEIEQIEKTLTKVSYAIGPDREHWYYQFFETGAGAHEIDGKVKKAIMFVSNGESIVRRIVHHPGMAADAFLRPAMDNKHDQAAETVGSVFWTAIERVVSSG